MNVASARFLAAVALSALLWGPNALAQSAVAEPTTTAAELPPAATDLIEAPEDAAKVLAARSPATVDDLRLIETQLQRVIQRALPSTCGVQIGAAAGSGVVVSKDGLVLTAAHVIGRPNRRAWIELPDGRRFRGRTLGANHDADAGMIKLDNPPDDLPFSPVSKGPDLKAGEWVVTIGQPGGIIEDRAPPVRFGRVLFLGGDVLCTDCKLVGGDSGGPLFNMRGEVVGIHSSIGPALTHNFHVPTSAFNKAWDRLVASELWGGRFDDDDEGRVLLGVSGRSQDGKCLITAVVPDLPGAKAGVKPGDVVTAVNGHEITTFDELAGIVFFKEPGDKLRLTIERGEEKMTLTAELVEQQD
jgi:serine protease Do